MPHEQLDHLYRTTKVPRRRTRAQMIVLAAEQGLKVPQPTISSPAPAYAFKKRRLKTPAIG